MDKFFNGGGQVVSRPPPAFFEMDDNGSGALKEPLLFRFFDVTAAVRSDTPVFLHFFQYMYQRFLIDPSEVDANEIREYGLYTKPGNRWGKRALILDGAVWPLDSAGVLQGYAYDGIINSILGSVNSHYLIHAAALSWKGKGVILVADAGQGKTTLTIELVKRNFRFLSDELAAIGREDGRLQAFPRRLRVRPDSLRRVGLSHLANSVQIAFEKYLPDIDDIQPDSLVENACLDTIILIDHEVNASAGDAENSRAFKVYLERVDEMLLKEIRQAPGVTQVEADHQSGFPVLHVKADHKGQAIEKIEQICAKQEVLILEISRKPLQEPTFHPEARLEAISRSEMILGLLRQYQPGHRSVLLKDEFGGSAARLFVNLARLLNTVECYRLKLGPLDQSVDLICDTICQENVR